APAPGDVFIVNDPFAGGSHLPDITLVTPVDVDAEVVAYTATRAHHSDVGGISPGSMPAGSRTIFQEGIVVPPVRLVRDGEYVEDVLGLVPAHVRTPELRPAVPYGPLAADEIGPERVAAL